MEHVLPKSFILDVLSRLPVKTIIRYKCVCKKWRDLVSDSKDPDFVNLHLSRSREALMIFDFYKPSREGDLVWVEIGNKGLVHVKKLHLKYCAYVAGFWLSQVGSVNGLICSAYHGRVFIIYNPVLEECMFIPQRPLYLETLGYGFGVSKAGEYKVIHISRSSDKLCAVEIEVYTLGTGQWRILGQTPFRTLGTDQLRILGQTPFRHKSIRGTADNGIYVNGHVYWIIHGQIYDFDLTSETLELFPSPPGDNRQSIKMLGVLKGRLSGVSWCSLGLEVWVMKEDSWSKEITILENISHLLDHKFDHKSHALCLLDGLKGACILWVSDEKELMEHCLNTNTIRPLNMKIYLERPITTYRPSFVKLVKFELEQVLANMYDRESRKKFVRGRW